MSDVIVPQITQAGLNELLNLPSGIQQAITHIGLGTGQFDQSDEAAVMNTADELIRIPVADSYEQTAGTVMFYASTLWSGSFTPIYSIRFYLASGTVLAAYSSTVVETALVNGQSNDLYYTLALDAIPADKIEIVSTQVVFNPGLNDISSRSTLSSAEELRAFTGWALFRNIEISGPDGGDFDLVDEPAGEDGAIYDGVRTSGTVISVAGQAGKHWRRRIDSAKYYLSWFLPPDTDQYLLKSANAMMGALPSDGFATVIVESGYSVKIENSFNILRSNTALVIERGAEIYTDTSTTSGHVLGFVAGSNYGGTNEDRIENVHVLGGGTVNAYAASGSENAIGFSRAKNFSCRSMTVSKAPWKGLTAQVECSGGVFSGNDLSGCVHSCLAIEGSNTSDVVASDNVIDGELCTGSAVDITFSIGDKISDIRLSGNTLKNGRISVSNVVNFSLTGGEIKNGTGATAITLYRCDNFNINQTVTNCNARLFSTSQCGFGTATLRATGINSSGASDIDAISISSPTSTQILNDIIVSGDSYRYGVNAIDNSANPVLMAGNSSFTGSTARLNGNISDSGYGRLNAVFKSLAYASSLQLDIFEGSLFNVSLTDDLQISSIINGRIGDSCKIRLVQPSGGGKLVTWPSNVKITGDILTSSGTLTMINLDYDGSNWRGFVAYTDQPI